MDMPNIMEAMMSPIIPMTFKQEQDQKKEEMERVSKMTSDTQILLAIFEKVVCIEERLEGEGKGYSPDPNQLGTNPVQLEM